MLQHSHKSRSIDQSPMSLLTFSHDALEYKPSIGKTFITKGTLRIFIALLMLTQYALFCCY